MRKFILLVFVFMFCSVRGQSVYDVDLLCEDICKTLISSKNLADSVRVNLALEKHLSAFVETHNIDNQAKFDTIYQRIYFRLQKNCIEFSNILANSYEVQGNWQMLPEKPKSTINKKVAHSLLERKFFYIEPSGKKVIVSVKDGFWTEQFEDKTFSKLKFRWTGDDEFQLEFIESSNLSRSNLSVYGDKYYYGIYGLQNNIFDVWSLHAAGTYVSFKLHPVR